MKKNFNTGIAVGVTIGGLLFGGIGAFAGQYVATENPFPVKFNNQEVALEGYNIEGSTYFKLRDIADTVGGFNVNFSNNTIFLTSENLFANTTIDTSTEEVKDEPKGLTYYADFAWCPDFGAYTGASLKEKRTGDSGMVFYIYDGLTGKSDTSYYDVLTDEVGLTYNPFSPKGFLLFEDTKNNRSVSIYLDDSTYSIIVGIK